MYMVLPETERRTLEDIEMHFADNSKKITDHKIQKMHKSKGKQENANESETIENNVKNKNQTINGCTNDGFTGDNLK